MMQLPPTLTPLQRLLSGLCAAFGVLLVAEVILLNGNDVQTRDDAEKRFSSQLIKPYAAGNALSVPPIVKFREVIERPLFIEDRRLPKENSSSKKSVQGVQLSGKWKLTGVFLVGDQSFAHVESVRERKTTRLQVDTELDGWRVSAIDSAGVRFSNGGETVTLALKENADSQGN